MLGHILMMAVLWHGSDTITARGSVFDSVSGKPLAGATVQLIGADSEVASVRFSVQSDSQGRFVIPGVPTGRYLAGFFHAALDTLHIEAKGTIVSVSAPWDRIVLATPSPRTIVATVCGTQQPAGSPTLLMGQVRHAESLVAATNGGVSVSWPEVQTVPATQGVHVETRQTTATLRGEGLFALCGLPPDVTVSLTGGSGSDSSGTVSVKLANHAFRFVSLLVAPAGARSRVVGSVRTSNGALLTSAQVRTGSRFAVTNSEGQFVLDSVPAGSQALEVKSIGYEPATVIAQVTTGEPTSLTVVMPNVVKLPTTVTWANASHYETFERHRRTSPMGYFIVPPHPDDYPPMLTPAQIGAHAPGTLYKNGILYFPGQRPGTWCVPKMFLNGIGVLDPGLGLSGKEPSDAAPADADQNQIGGVEVYLNPTDVPGDYNVGIGSLQCGILVVWTK